MKKLTLIALVGIALGLIYLAVKESPAPVAAPKIKGSDETASASSASSRFLAQHASPASVVAVAAKQTRSFTKSSTVVSRRIVRETVKVAPAAARQEMMAATTVPTAKASQPVAGKVKLPKANDSKWVSHLSGENVDLAVRRNDLSGTDCTQQICPDRANAYTLVGVVVEPQRIVRRNHATLDGDLAAGDGHNRPFTYLK
jgi:hypothetical protein